MESNALAYLGAGLGAGVAIVGGGIGIGLLAMGAMGGIARQPQSAATIQTAMLIAAALIDSCGCDAKRTPDELSGNHPPDVEFHRAARDDRQGSSGGCRDQQSFLHRRFATDHRGDACTPAGGAQSVRYR